MIGRAVLVLATLCTGCLAVGTATQPAVPTGEVRWKNVPFTDTVFQPAKYDDLAQWQQRSRRLREQVEFAAGLAVEPDRTPLNARIFDRLERDGYTVEKVCFESRPGFYVTGNLYRPRNLIGKVPAVASPHGHSVFGRLRHEELGSAPARAMTLARAGAVVFAWDMIGYNDSKRQIEHRINTPQRELWGVTSFGLQTWNSIRVLDFLQSLPEVDGNRIGVTGESGGGTQTFILSAVDPRVSVSVPVVMVSSLMQGGCMCENAPGLRIDANNMEIAALFAPKPQLLISATGDWTKLTPKVEFPFIRSVYSLFGAAELIENAHIDAPHNYNAASRRAMYQFMAKHLLKLAEDKPIVEGNVDTFTNEQLLIWNENNLPSSMVTVDDIVAQTRSRVESFFAPLLGDKADSSDDSDAMRTQLLAMVRRRVSHLIASEFPTRKQIAAIPPETAPAEIALDSDGLARRITVFVRQQRPVKTLSLQRPSATATPLVRTVLVHPEGIAAAGQLREFITELASAGQEVVLIEPFGTGENRPPAKLDKPRGSTKYFTCFNRTDAAETVFDILTALGALTDDDRLNRVQLVGVGELGPACLIARSMLPIERKYAVSTVLDMDRFELDSDQAYVDRLFLPNIRAIGGLRSIATAACNGPIWFHNALPAMKASTLRQAIRGSDIPIQITHERADWHQVAEWLAGSSGVSR